MDELERFAQALVSGKPLEQAYVEVVAKPDIPTVTKPFLIEMLNSRMPSWRYCAVEALADFSDDDEVMQALKARAEVETNNTVRALLACTAFP